LVTVTSEQEQTATRFREGYGAGVTRWAVPRDRLTGEGDEAFRTVGDLELHLFLGVRNGKGDWYKVLVQRGGHALDLRHDQPVVPPMTGVA
jgi:hypothetical protein